nr:hypothetical protein B0A51_04215 [Rachicladosporium sp. CCFEE 5018]
MSAIRTSDSKVEETASTHLEDVPSNATEVKQPGVTARALVIVVAINTIYFAQLVNIVGSGSLARDITAVVGGSTESVWFTSTIAILTAVLSPRVSQAADLWGRRWILVALTACGCIGAIIVSRATNVGQVIAGFTVGGICYGAQPLLHAVTSEVLPRKYRAWAQASVNVSASLGGIYALLVGGALTRNQRPENFRTYWYTAAGIYAIAALIVAVLYRPPPRELQVTLTTNEKLRHLDWLGYALLVSSLTLFSLGLSWAQNPLPWTSPAVLAPLIIGVALVGALLLYEIRFKKDGLLHHDLFRHRNFPISLFCIFTEGLSFYCANNYFAFEVGTLYTHDALRVGLHYSITFYCLIFFALLAAVYCSAVKAVRLPTCAAFTMFALFNALMATIRTTTPEANLWGYAIFLGAALGVCLTSLVTAAQFATPPALIAITSGLMIGMRSLGGVVGLAIYGAIFNAALSSNIASRVAGASIALDLPRTSVAGLIGALSAGDMTGALAIPGVTPTILEAAGGGLQRSFVIAFRNVWIAAASFSLAAVVASLFLVDPKSSFDERVDAPLKVLPLHVQSKGYI